MGLSVRSGSDEDVDAVFELDRATWSPQGSPGPRPTSPHELTDKHDLLVAETTRRWSGT